MEHSNPAYRSKETEMKNMGKTQRLWWQLVLAACLCLMTSAGMPSSGAAQLRGQVPAGAGTIIGQIVMNLDLHPTRTCGRAKFTIGDSHNATKIAWGEGAAHLDVRTNTIEWL
jgi:hypothetical protein